MIPGIGRWRTLALLGLSLVGGEAGAQLADPPCRRPELEQASFLLGRWRVVDETAGRVGRSEWSPEAASCVLLERLAFGDSTAPVRELRLLAFDHRNAVWDLASADTDHGNLVTIRGRATPGGLVFEHSEMRLGRLLLDRITVQREGDDAFTWTIESSRDAGVTWATVVRRRYERTVHP